MFLEEGQWTFDLWDWASLLEGWHPENLQSQGWSLFVQMGQHHDQNVKNIPNLRYSIRLVIHKTWPVLSVFFGGGNAAFPTDMERNKINPSMLEKTGGESLQWLSSRQCHVDFSTGTVDDLSKKGCWLILVTFGTWWSWNFWAPVVWLFRG